MSTDRPILVTGATGTTGSRVVSGLRRAGVAVRAASRTPAPDRVVFDWQDTESHARVLSGVRAVYLVAPVELELVTPFLEVASTERIRRVVQLSSSAVQRGDPGLGAIHDQIATSFPEHTILRPSWFMQNFVGEHPLAQGIRHRRELITATGEGRLGFIDADDIAAVAVQALLAGEPIAPELILTGPEALSYPQAADLITDVSGTAVHHVDLSTEQYLRHLTAAGYPQDLATTLAALDNQIRNGAQNFVTDTVLHITGRSPRSLRRFLIEHRDALAA